MYNIIHYNHSKYGLVVDFFANISAIELVLYIGMISLIVFLINKKKS